MPGGHVQEPVGHNDFANDSDKSPGFLSIVTWLEGTFLYECLR